MPKNEEVYHRSTIRTDKEWAQRYIYEGDTCNEEFKDSIKHNHRSLLLERISSYSPISRILEIGCGSGPNLYLLSKKFSDAEIVGIDINPAAVQKGNEIFKKDKISNVRLEEGKAQELGGFKDKSFDIVLTDAILIYIDPNEISPIMKEILRVGKVVILNEWHCFNKYMALCTDIYYSFYLRYEAMKFSGEKINILNRLFQTKYASLGLFTGHWTRDYITLIEQFVPRDKIKITKIPKDLWKDKRWQKWGAIIEVDIR